MRDGRILNCRTGVEPDTRCPTGIPAKIDRAKGEFKRPWPFIAYRQCPAHITIGGLSHRIKHLAQSKAYVANCPIPPVELCIVEPEMFIHKTLGMLFQSNVKRSKVAFAQTPKSFSKTPRECSSIIGCSICWYASLQLYR